MYAMPESIVYPTMAELQKRGTVNMCYFDVFRQYPAWSSNRALIDIIWASANNLVTNCPSSYNINIM